MSSRLERKAIPWPNPMAIPARHQASERPIIWIIKPKVLSDHCEQEQARGAAAGMEVVQSHFCASRRLRGRRGDQEFSERQAFIAAPNVFDINANGLAYRETLPIQFGFAAIRIDNPGATQNENFLAFEDDRAGD